MTMTDAAWTNAEWKDASRVVMSDPAWSEFIHALLRDLKAAPTTTVKQDDERTVKANTATA